MGSGEIKNLIKGTEDRKHVSVDYILVSTCIIIFLVAWHMSYAPRLLKNQKLIIELLQKRQQ